jgi:hypothetical protein
MRLTLAMMYIYVFIHELSFYIQNIAFMLISAEEEPKKIAEVER